MGGSMIDTAISGGLQAYGQIFEGEAQAKAYQYNQAVATQNAHTALENANLVAESGTAQAAMVQMHNRQASGQIEAQQSASGLDVNTGSAVDVKSSQREIGVTDAYNSRIAAIREAYGYQTKAVNEQAEAAMDKYEGQVSEEAGYIGAAGTIMGTLGKESDEYGQYLAMGGFGG